jgi:hypothetical protein
MAVSNDLRVSRVSSFSASWMLANSNARASEFKRFSWGLLGIKCLRMPDTGNSAVKISLYFISYGLHNSIDAPYGI